MPVTVSTRADWGPEERLLAETCATSLTGAAAPGYAGSVDWERFVRLVRRHRVVPLVARQVRELAGLGMPPELGERLRAEQRGNAMACLLMSSHLVAIADALEAAGIGFVPLKGVALGASLYGDVAARQSGDLDFLVPEERVNEADGIIRRLGYSRLSAETHDVVPDDFVEDQEIVRHLNYGRDGVLLEMHVRLHKNPALMPVRVEEIVSHGRTVRIGGRAMSVMSDPLHFVFLATHGSRHTWKRLQWVCDIAAMVTRAGDRDVGEWLNEASRFGLQNAAVQALVMSHRLLGTPLPERARRAFSRSAPIRYMVSRAELTIFRSLEDEPDDPGGFDAAVRLYRLCMTARPAYHWHEVKRGMHVLAGRLMGVGGSA